MSTEIFVHASDLRAEHPVGEWIASSGACLYSSYFVGMKFYKKGQRIANYLGISYS